MSQPEVKLYLYNTRLQIRVPPQETKGPGRFKTSKLSLNSLILT
jgi:hypothetical protein